MSINNPFKRLEIENALTQNQESSITIEEFMHSRMERMTPPDLSTVKSWKIKADKRPKPSFIEVSPDGKPNIYETTIPEHKLATNLPIDSPKEIEIHTFPFDGSEPSVAGYGISPVNPKWRRQREIMPNGIIGAVIAIEANDGSRSIGINIPAKAYKKVDANGKPLSYGHPAQDGFVMKPFQINHRTQSNDQDLWDKSIGFATVITDGNTSKEVRESELARHPGVIMKKLKGGRTYQVLGQPEPFSNLALTHVIDVAQFVDPRFQVKAVTTDIARAHKLLEEGHITRVRGGTTATFTAQILPNSQHDGFYRNHNFQPEALPGRTNLGRSILLSCEANDDTVIETRLNCVKVKNPRGLEASNVVINDEMPSIAFEQPNWWEFLSVGDIFENQGNGIRIETTDGIVAIKDPKRLKEILSTMPIEDIITLLSSEKELSRIFELHPHDDATIIITEPGVSRGSESRVPSYLRSTLTLIRQAGQKYAKNISEYAAIEGLKAQSRELENKILETVKYKIADGTLAQLAMEFEELTKRIHTLEVQHAIDEDLNKTLGSKDQRDIYLSHCAALDMAKQIDRRKGKNEDVSKALSVLFDIAENKLPIVVIPKDLDIKMMREVYIELANLGILRLKKPEDYAKSLEILSNIRGTFKVRSLRKLLGTSALSLLKELGNYANTGESKELPKWGKETETLLETLELYTQQ